MTALRISMETAAVISGWIDHDRARYYFQDGHALTGWNYVDGMKFYFNQSGALIMDVDDIIGKQKSYKLRVNKELNCLTVFAKDGDNGYILPVKSMLTSVGDDTPVGTLQDTGEIPLETDGE